MKYIRELEGLRGLMAWWVVIGHWSTTAPIPHFIGKTKLYNGYAVDVFVILSGFAIAALIDKRPERFGMYITRRFLRIFPVYLFFLVISALLAPLALQTWQAAPAGYMQDNRIRIATDSLTYFWPHLWAHLAAVQGLIPDRFLPSTDYAFLGQAWSISLEWQFYLIAPFMIAWARPSAPLGRMVWLLFVAAVCVALSRFMPAGFLGTHLHKFLIGIFSFAFLKARFEGNPVLQFPMLPFAVFGVPVLVFLNTPAALPYAIWTLMMVTIVIAHEHSKGPFAALSRMFTHPLALNAGKMAYSVYLSHMIVIIVALNLLEPMNLGNVTLSVALLGLTLVGTLVVSTIAYRLLEDPFHKLGKSLKDPRNPPAPV